MKTTIATWYAQIISVIRPPRKLPSKLREEQKANPMRGEPPWCPNRRACNQVVPAAARPGAGANRVLHTGANRTSSSSCTHVNPLEFSVCSYAHCTTRFETVRSAMIPVLSLHFLSDLRTVYSAPSTLPIRAYGPRNLMKIGQSRGTMRDMGSGEVGETVALLRL